VTAATEGSGEVTTQLYVNSADGDAWVGQQVGYIDTQINGNVTHEHYAYQLTNDSPEEQFRIAKEHLRGGAPTTAEGLIADAVARDRLFPEAAYYWALAILSGRPFDHLVAAEFGKLRDIFDRALAGGLDEWHQPLRVIEEFVEWWIAGEVAPDAEPDKGKFDQAMADKELLPPPRRQEIDRHLAMVLHWGQLDRSDSDIAEEIERRRMRKDRRNRVPLFFEPDPEKPRRRHVQAPDYGRKDVLVLAAQLALAAIGVFLLTAAAVRSGVLEAVLMSLTYLTGAALAIRIGLPYQYAIARLRAKDREFTIRADRPAARERKAREEHSDLDVLIAQRFAGALPPDPDDPEAGARFRTETNPWRIRLRDEIMDAYGDPPVETNKLDWLIRWHAAQTAGAWQNRSLYDYRAELRPAPGALGRLILAGTVFLGGFLAALVTAFGGAPGLAIGALVAVAAGSVAVRDGCMIYNERRRERDEYAAAARLERDEWVAYHQEVARLSARPTDAQMAEWLEYDKEFVRTQAMRQYTLKSADVISYFVLTEPAPGCQEARNKYGTTRYSRYIVKLFLLTNNGVREVEQLLDFATGATNKEQRRVFRYSAIAAVNTTPRTVRPHGRRQVAPVAGGGPRNQPPRPVLRQAFQITLLNGPDIAIEANYDTLLPDELRERSRALANLVEETTGANSALLTLESVAAEGQDWIKREKERMRHKLAEFRRRD
jgi:hypothetical protein